MVQINHLIDHRSKRILKKELHSEQKNNEVLPKTLIELLQNTNTEFMKLKDSSDSKERSEIISKININLGIKIHRS